MFQYISKEGQEHLKKFQYKGQCDSITYKHLWSPLADWLLQFVPTSIAPNTITFSALLILTVSHLIFVAGVGEGQIAWWRLLLMGVSIFVYQNLDNMDGKQARKTKTSSPLGMLFDHGADAVISFLLGIQVLEVMQVESVTIKIFSISCMVMVVYFCALWSQYSIGFFRLGIVNPVDEGLPSYALFAIINIFVPYTFWNQDFFGFKPNEFILLIIQFLAFPVGYYMIKDNYSKAIIPSNSITFAIFLPISFAVAILTLYFSSKCPFDEAFWPIFYSLLFSWSRNMIEMQLYYVTKQKYNPFNVGTLGFVLPSLAFLLSNSPPNAYFWGVAGLSAFIFFEFVISVIRQSCKILNIRVFSISSKSE